MKLNKIFNKDFSMVVIGQIISLFGNQILRFSLPLYLLSETGSAWLYGMVSALSFIPMVILSPIGGIIADRVNKRNVMVILDFSTAALSGILALTLGKFNLVVLLLISLIIFYAIHGAYQPTVQASIPHLVPTDGIMLANATVNLVSSSANLIGPVAGGLLFASVGIMPILYIGIGCFTASAIMEIFIKIPYKKIKSEGSIFKIARGDLKVSFNFLKNEQPCIWKVCLIMASINLVVSALLVIGIPVIIKYHLGFSEHRGNTFYGFAQGCMAVGSIIGGVSAGTYARKFPVDKCPPLIFICATPLLFIALSLMLPFSGIVKYIIIAAGCFFMMLLAAMFSILMLGHLQILTPKNLVGKVVGVAMSIAMCATPIGQALYGVLFEKLGDRPYIMFYAAFGISIIISLLSINVFKDMKKATSDYYSA